MKATRYISRFLKVESSCYLAVVKNYENHVQKLY